jgi:hypothetical protein
MAPPHFEQSEIVCDMPTPVEKLRDRPNAAELLLLLLPADVASRCVVRPARDILLCAAAGFKHFRARPTTSAKTGLPAPSGARRVSLKQFPNDAANRAPSISGLP